MAFVTFLNFYPPGGVKLRPSERRYKPYIVVLLVRLGTLPAGPFRVKNLVKAPWPRASTCAKCAMRASGPERCVGSKSVIVPRRSWRNGLNWEKYFDLKRVQDAHDRRNCRDQNGEEPWACGNCDCSARLEQRLKATGAPFLESLGQRKQWLPTMPRQVSSSFASLFPGSYRISTS
jgi:hypothetical protein